LNPHDEHDDIVKKETFSPSNDVNDDVVNDANEVCKEPQQSFARPFAAPLPVAQRMDKTKLNLQSTLIFYSLMSCLKCLLMLSF